MAVLARVALIALGALLLVTTGYLVVQVRTGPITADDASRAPAAAAVTPASTAAPSTAPERERAIEQGAPRRHTAAPPAPPTPSLPEATAIAANLSFDEANKLYDRREYEDARALALTLLRDHPTSVRMRRVVVASSCIMGDHDVAQQHYLSLPEKDRADMRQRCIPYGSNFHE